MSRPATAGASTMTTGMQAQEAGSGFKFFTEPDDSSSLRVLNLDRMMREAIRNNDLELAYQPIMATTTGKVVGAEALLRWHHAQEGTISPADFVPVAEQTGLMQQIGSLVRRGRHQNTARPVTTQLQHRLADCLCLARARRPKDDVRHALCRGVRFQDETNGATLLGIQVSIKGGECQRLILL